MRIMQNICHLVDGLRVQDESSDLLCRTFITYVLQTAARYVFQPFIQNICHLVDNLPVKVGGKIKFPASDTCQLPPPDLNPISSNF